MRRFYCITAIAIAAGLAGCQGHQDKVDALQKDYEEKSATMKKDCAAEYLQLPLHLSSKCTEENKQVTDAYKRLQVEKAKP